VTLMPIGNIIRKHQRKEIMISWLLTILSNKFRRYRGTTPKIIESASNSLLGVINDILDFSKIEAGKLDIENIDFDLQGVIDNVNNLLEYKAQQKNLKFTIDYDQQMNMHLHGDPLRLGQILTNLANNAIKFTEQGEVSVTIQELENHLYRFEVKDTGIGLKPEEQKKLFQSFTQADGSTTRKYGGTGLGLAISKQLIQLMNGHIRLHSEYAKGSIFTVEVPLLPEKNIQESDNSMVTTLEEDKRNIRLLSGSQILLAEDNEMNRLIIHSLLEGSGIQIEDAQNGQVAVDKYIAEPDRFELILTDIQMPVMDGYETAKMVRENDKNVPIIALTASAMKQDIEKTRFFGMNEHLNKPIDVQEFYRILLKYIPAKSNLVSIEKSNNEHNINHINSKYLDSRKGLALMANNQDLYGKILLDFVGNYEDSADKIEHFLKADIESAKRLVHTIKGLALNIGAQALHEACLDLEENPSTEDINEYRLLLDEVINLIKTSQWFQKNVHDAEVDVDNLLLQLLDILPRKRARLCKPILEKIEENTSDSQLITVVQEVNSLIKKYKFEEAINLVKNFQYGQ